LVWLERHNYDVTVTPWRAAVEAARGNERPRRGRAGQPAGFVPVGGPAIRPRAGDGGALLHSQAVGEKAPARRIY